ncbi:MAG: carbon storage regulator [Pirellulales bacterium]|nr:carbon storage regulator [Pirellulales bacterium]
MLVLSRKESQKIRLGDSIVITVVRLAGDKVRLGIEAPKEILVLRDELKPFETPSGVAAHDQAGNAQTAGVQNCKMETSHVA